MNRAFTESVVEEAALAWLESLGWRVRNRAEIAPGEPAAERDDYRRAVLAQRLRDALARLKPALPTEALEDAVSKLTRREGAGLIVRNRALHRILVDAVTVEYRDAEGSIPDTQARATPSARAMQAFEKCVRPLFERIVQFARESRTLTTLCDRLLPKIISGEQRIATARRLIEVTA